MIIDALSCSTVSLEMQFVSEAGDRQKISNGTGFFWKSANQRVFLITNWHNVTGKSLDTKKHLSKTAAEPNVIRGIFHYFCGLSGNIGGAEFHIQLSNRNNDKFWIEHRDKEVDIVAIELSHFLPQLSLETTKLVFANDFVSNISLTISQDVFILGYPLGISVQDYPIWKRASIASEPICNAYKEMPTIIVDTASRKGMSGAPVFAVFRAGTAYSNSQEVIINCQDIKSFVGIYSGRLNSKLVSEDKIESQYEMDAQLGIIWKKELIDEIVENGVVAK